MPPVSDALPEMLWAVTAPALHEPTPLLGVDSEP